MISTQQFQNSCVTLISNRPEMKQNKYIIETEWYNTVYSMSAYVLIHYSHSVQYVCIRTRTLLTQCTVCVHTYSYTTHTVYSMSAYILILYTTHTVYSMSAYILILYTTHTVYSMDEFSVVQTYRKFMCSHK